YRRGAAAEGAGLYSLGETGAKERAAARESSKPPSRNIRDFGGPPEWPRVPRPIWRSIPKRRSIPLVVTPHVDAAEARRALKQMRIDYGKIKLEWLLPLSPPPQSPVRDRERTPNASARRLKSDRRHSPRYPERCPG